jgi:hypothetical protein
MGSFFSRLLVEIAEFVWQLGCRGAAPLRPPRKFSKISAAL